jgi:hypothetical protein
VTEERNRLSSEKTMRFLCLIRAEKVMEQLAAADAERHFAEYTQFDRSIRASGHYVDCNRLLPPASAITVRVRGGSTSATDGPFAETKEQLGGYYVIEARDLNEAIQIASRIPPAQIGSIEVRPIRPIRESPRPVKAHTEA